MGKSFSPNSSATQLTNAVHQTGSEELARRDALEAADPIYTQTLAAYIMERLQVAQNRGIGPYWEKMDGNTRGKLVQLLS